MSPNLYNVLNTKSDYYSFGMVMPGRSGVATGGEYRFSFNGKEAEEEISGTDSHLDYGARIYDARIGRWLSRDPLESKYPGISPYVFVANMPTIAVDPDGKDIKMIIFEQPGSKPEIHVYVTGSVIDLSGSWFNQAKHIVDKVNSMDQMLSMNSVYLVGSGINNADGHAIKEADVYFHFDFDVVTDLQQVPKDDHLIVVVPKMLPLGTSYPIIPGTKGERQEVKQYAAGITNSEGGRTAFINSAMRSSRQDRAAAHEVLCHFLNIGHNENMSTFLKQTGGKGEDIEKGDVLKALKQIYNKNVNRGPSVIEENGQLVPNFSAARGAIDVQEMKKAIENYSSGGKYQRRKKTPRENYKIKVTNGRKGRRVSKKISF